MGYTYALAGEKDKTEQILDKLITWKNKGRNIRSYFIALIYIGLGDYNNTFEWLEKAYKERNFMMRYIKVFKDWDPIRSDPRYKALLKKMNLPEN